MKVESNIVGSVLACLRRKYRLNYFVETGTARGDTAELAAIAFDKVFTCEIDPRLAGLAAARLAVYPHVQVYSMHSPDFLRKIKSRVSQPAMYWLDAHWCGGAVKPERECPLLEELTEIGSLHGHSVILIDDVGLMRQPPPPPHDPTHWPTLVQIQEVFEAWGEEIETVVERGWNSEILVATPRPGYEAEWLRRINDRDDSS